MRKYFFLIISGLWASAAFCQTQPEARFDSIHFFESERTPQMVYIKWFSTGNNPAPDFIPVRYKPGEPIEAVGIKMLYQRNDTTFYVLQDTITPFLAIDSNLQYFLAPIDTLGQAGQTSDIVIIPNTITKRHWFSSTQAEKLGREKGITISWKMNTYEDVKMFELFKSRYLERGFEKIATIPASELSFTDYDTEADINYYYQIIAITNSGNKPLTSNVIFSASYNPNPPIPPFIEFARGVKGGVHLRIQATDAEAAGVRIYRDDGLDPELSLISSLVRFESGEDFVEYYDTLTLLSGRRTYTYAAVTESTSFVESAFSNKAYARPLISTPPESPLSLDAYEENGRVRLFWEDMEENNIAIVGYKIFRKETDGAFSDLFDPESIFLLNNHTDSTAQAGKTYTYKVHSVDLDGNVSTEGALATVSLPINIPVAPFGLRTISIEEGMQLEWSRAIYPDIQSVLVYRSQEGGTPLLIATLEADAEEYLDRDVQTGKWYTYHLTTKNLEGTESEPSEEASEFR
ncbi:MAG: hypothetical protein V2I46_04590 [Bacteroides sp.]|jgi:fibronectin type 3 domain-containing protein|nr:hypothetical protein [Bacteroides sp.]